MSSSHLSALQRAAAVPSWGKLADDAAARAATVADKLKVAGRRGTWDLAEGPPSAQARIRTFGADPSNIRVTFYRDNHAWCPNCHRVWLQLEEKRIPYRVEKICMRIYGKKPKAFLEKVPHGEKARIPMVVLDGRVITESIRIMQRLEDTFRHHQPTLLPLEASTARLEVDRVAQLEEKLSRARFAWLRDESAGAKRAFLQALDATEAALDRYGGPYLLGADFTLADCIIAPTLERIAPTVLFYKGLNIRHHGYPRIAVWFFEMENRPSYRATQSDTHTHAHYLPVQMHARRIGKVIPSGTPEQQQVSAVVDGADGKSWCLPLPPLRSSPEPLSAEVEDPPTDRL